MSFFDDFIRKLEDDGFTCRDDEYGDYEYIKDKTIIHFGNVQESYIENQFEYYYFNYYIYSI